MRTPCPEQTTNPRHVFSVSLFPCLSGTCWGCAAAPGHFPFATNGAPRVAGRDGNDALFARAPKNIWGCQSSGYPPAFQKLPSGSALARRGTGWIVARRPRACQGRGSGAGVTASPVCRTALPQRRRGRLPEPRPERGAGVWAGPREGAGPAGSEPARAAPAPRPLARERRGRALRQSLAVPSALTGSAEIAAGPVLPPPWPRSLRTEVARAATAAAAAASGAAFSP